MKEFWYYLESCWAVFWAGKAWRDAMVQFAMMAEEDWKEEGVDAVEVNIVVAIEDGYASTMTKRYDLEE